MTTTIKAVHIMVVTVVTQLWKGEKLKRITVHRLISLYHYHSTVVHIYDVIKTNSCVLWLWCFQCTDIDTDNLVDSPKDPCGFPKCKGDDNCDDENNNKDCAYDDGDCCVLRQNCERGERKKDYCTQVDSRVKCLCLVESRVSWCYRYGKLTAHNVISMLMCPVQVSRPGSRNPPD